MGAEQDEANARLPLLDPQGLTREQRNLYERIEDGMLPWAQQSGFKAATADGRLLGPFNAMLYNHEIGAAQLQLQAAERLATELDAMVREVVILTVGAACQAAYEVYAHRAVAAKTGLAAEDIEALATGGEPRGLKPNELTAHRFVKTLVEKHRVPEVLYAEAAKAFGHKGLVDMLHLVGLYLAVSAMLNAFEVPVPETAG